MSIDPDPGSDSRAAPTPASGPTPPRSALPRSLAVALGVGLPAPAYEVVVSATTAGTHHLQGIWEPHPAPAMPRAAAGHLPETDRRASRRQATAARRATPITRQCAVIRRQAVFAGSGNAELRMQRDVLRRSTALWVAEATGKNGG